MVPLLLIWGAEWRFFRKFQDDAQTGMRMTTAGKRQEKHEKRKWFKDGLATRLRQIGRSYASLCVKVRMVVVREVCKLGSCLTMDVMKIENDATCLARTLIRTIKMSPHLCMSISINSSTCYVYCWICIVKISACLVGDTCHAI